jgi:hypothetical protein
MISFDDFLLLSEEKNLHGQEMRAFLYRLRLYSAEKQKFYKLLFKKQYEKIKRINKDKTN